MIKPRTRAGTFTTFVNRYEPIEAEDGAISRPWDDPDIHLAFANERFAYVWTIVDGDRCMYLVPGFATVNYVGRVLCAKPYPPEEEALPGYVW